MKKVTMVNLSGPLEAWAARILREIPGVTATVAARGSDRGADFWLTFAGKRQPVTVEVKRSANAATARQLVHDAADAARSHPPVILIADHATTEARRILEENEIGLVDGSGNVHIQLTGLLLHLEGRRTEPRARPRTGLSGKAGVAAQALLLHPDRRWQVQTLAERAGISAGLAHRVLTRLEAEGIVAAEGSGPRRVRLLTNAAALLDLWAEENVDRPIRTRAYLLATSPRRLLDEVSGHLQRGDVNHAFTGAAAASRLAPFATAIPVTEVWVEATAAPEELLRAAQATPVDEGYNVTFLQAKDDAPLAFRDHADGTWLANRFRVFVDLRHDPRRGREQAEHLRQEVIGF